MTQEQEDVIKRAYAAFNERNIDTVLSLMHPDVHWPNGWEGGYVTGHEQVREYWTRQWKEINPKVYPVSIKEENGQIEVEVHQVAKDLQENVLFDGIVKHIYTFDEGKIKCMEIVKDE